MVGELTRIYHTVIAWNLSSNTLTCHSSGRRITLCIREGEDQIKKMDIQQESKYTFSHTVNSLIKTLCCSSNLDGGPAHQRNVNYSTATSMESPSKVPRRIIGQAVDNDSASVANSSDTKPTDALERMHCPICEEEMVSLLQLNRHLDDVHGHQSRESTPQKSPRVRRTIKVDLYDDNMGFGLSDNLSSDLQQPTAGKAKLTRSHWKLPNSTSTNVCSHAGCKKVLNVKNGVVNCRNCGLLFCNQHTSFRERLSNGPPPQYLPVYDSVNGLFARCCEKCYMNKPLLVNGTQVNHRDLSAVFEKKRAEKIEEKKWIKVQLQRRFLKLVMLLSLSYLWHIENGGFLLYFSERKEFSKENILEAEKEIVGQDNWQRDLDVTHCPLCFVKFNVLIRKHHCRLCGRVVSENAFNTDDPDMNCSLQVPVNIVLKRLPNLNYSPQVKDNWERLISPEPRFANLYLFRCCRECKNLLFSGTKQENGSCNEYDSLLTAYGELLAIKASLQATMPRFEHLVDENQENANHDINRLRVRILKYVKDFEIATIGFRQRFFRRNAETGKYVPVNSPVLTTNIYKMAIVFLQDSILDFKKVCDRFQQLENARLADQLGVHSESASVSESPATSPPKLTKKQIRELREELMVVNEQKFLVQRQMENAKKQRRFDELQTLTANTTELQKRIDYLEAELGDFGFS